MEYLKTPNNFLSRECDRKFLIAFHGVDKPRESAGYFMFRIWQDYAQNGTDRREIGVAAYGEDPACQILEEATGWKGLPGKLVQIAVESGFMVVSDEEAGKRSLQVAGFFPLNLRSKTEGGARRKGAMGAAVSKLAKGAVMDTAQQVELWSRSEAPGDLDPKDRKEATLLVHVLCRCLAMAPPTKNQWENGILLKQAAAVRAAFGDEQLESVWRYLVANRDNPEIPKRVDLALNNFKKYVGLAQEQGL